MSMYEKAPPRELVGDKGVPGDEGVAGVTGLEVPGDSGISKSEESDWKGNGIWRLGRSPILKREGYASGSSSDEE